MRLFRTVYNANVRIGQGPGIIALTYEMIHDTRRTAALDMTARPEGLFEYACHEGNHSMRNILSAARAAEQGATPAQNERTGR